MARNSRAVVALLIGLTTIGFALPASSTTWNTGCETYIVNHVNAARTARGIHSLVVTNHARYEARKWSLWMATHDALKHDSHLASEFIVWTELGQNVGDGPTCRSVWLALMASPEHRRNILHRAYDRIGVGVIWARGRDWVTQDFQAL